MTDPVRPTPWMIVLTLFAVACAHPDPAPTKPLVPVITIAPIPTGSPYAEAYTAQPARDASTAALDASVVEVDTHGLQCTYHVIGHTQEFPSPLLAVLEAMKMGLTQDQVEISCYRETSVLEVPLPTTVLVP